MNVLFTVQGDGRGHMTQAIAMKEMLQHHGHRVVAVLVGTNQGQRLPNFFWEGFDAAVIPFSSPGFSLKESRTISTLRSAVHLVCHLRNYERSLITIESAIDYFGPDLIINFLEPLMGLLKLLRRTRVPTLAVGHHFMFEHPHYPALSGNGLQRLAIRQYVRLVGAGSARLALSFYPAPDLPERRTFVCPPILRRQLFELESTSTGRHLLVYLLNHGYAADILAWHRQNPEVPIHCFYDKPFAPAEETIDPNLTFHALHGEKYLRLMASSRGVVCTAGFETVSEAAYLGKLLLMVPVGNHPEQHTNSRDAQLAGLGLRDTSFRLSRLLEPCNALATGQFRAWVDQAETIAVRAAEAAAAPAARTRLFPSGSHAVARQQLARLPGTQPIV